jgi:hypothetical protein
MPGGESMKARCLVSFFSDEVSGTKGEIIEINDQQTFDELLLAEYIEAVENVSPSKKIGDTPQEVSIKSKRKANDSNENQ